MSDVKKLMDEDRKELMKERASIIRSRIVDLMRESISNKQSNLTPMSQPEPITQDSPHLTPQIDDLNNLIEEVDIKKSSNKRKTSTPLNDTDNKTTIKKS